MLTVFEFDALGDCLARTVYGNGPLIAGLPNGTRFGLNDAPAHASALLKKIKAHRSQGKIDYIEIQNGE